MMRIASALAAGLVLAAPSAGPAQPPSDRAPRAHVALAPYRYGDLLWENDLTAHRIYSRALEAAEPPSGSGIDAWGKAVRWPFMERQLKGADYHHDSGEGLDFYQVGQSRGAGGLGVWFDNKLWTSRNYAAARILKDGPDVAEFEVDYAPWPVDVGRRVWETRRFTLPLGTRFTRLVSTLNSDTPDPLTVGVGLARRATSGPAKARLDAAHGVLTVWSPDSAEHGDMALALLFDPAQFAGYKEDADNFLVLLRERPGRPFVYYMGAAWTRGPDIRSPADWEAYVAAQKPRFDPP